jgi:phospholipid transport system substrate-binding protein
VGDRPKRQRTATWRLCALAGAALSTIVFTRPALCAVPAGPLTEIKTTVNKVIAILNDPAMKSNAVQRRQALKDSVAGHFDFAEMGKSALGFHWKELSEQQRKGFVDLFTRFIQASYISRIESYSGQQIDYVKETMDGPDYAQVNTNIVQEGKEPIALNYRVKLEEGTWRVYDVTVENISIVANYRNQFNRKINNEGFDALMDSMRAKQEGLDARIAN